MTRTYEQLSAEECGVLMAMKLEGRSACSIAGALASLPNTVTRELRRNGYKAESELDVMGRPRVAGGYSARRAGLRARRVRRLARPSPSCTVKACSGARCEACSSASSRPSWSLPHSGAATPTRAPCKLPTRPSTPRSTPPCGASWCLVKGAQLKIEIAGGSIVLHTDVNTALGRLGGKCKLAQGLKSTDEALRDPYPPPRKLR